MSEHLRKVEYASESVHEPEGPERQALKHRHEEASKARHEHAERLDEIRKEAEAVAASSHDIRRNQEPEKPTAESEITLPINRELKDTAYQRTLSRTRRQMSAPSRTFSKIVHQPAVEAVSDTMATTVARPSGILAGGITAFIGSSLFLWISRHYGYEYNFLLFSLLFIGGFFIGLIIELVLRFTAKKR